jgi:hypothetical protein
MPCRLVAFGFNLLEKRCVLPLWQVVTKMPLDGVASRLSDVENRLE